MEDCSTDCAEELAHGQVRRRSDRGAMTDTIAHVRSARTLLFVPGCRPDRFDKAAAVRPDIVLIDLEDLSHPTDKSMARDHARAWLNGGREAAVRINAIGTTWHEDDLEMVSRCGATVMLPKADSAEQVIQVLGRADSSVVIPLIETAAGITSALSICAMPGVQRVAFGSIDLATQLGIDPLEPRGTPWVAVDARTGVCSSEPGAADRRCHDFACRSHGHPGRFPLRPTPGNDGQAVHPPVPRCRQSTRRPDPRRTRLLGLRASWREPIPVAPQSPLGVRWSTVQFWNVLNG